MNTKHKFYLLIPLMYLFISSFLYSQNDSIMILDAKGSLQLLGIDYSPDGTRIAAGYNQRIIIWDAIKGIPIDTINKVEGTNITVRYSHDGSKIVCSGDTTPQMWDASTGELLRTFTGKPLQSWDFMVGATFSHDDKKIVGCSSDSTVSIWDVDSGELIKRFKAHDNVLQDALFTLDDSKIITCSFDSTIKIWDANTYILLKTIKEHNGWVIRLAISPDGLKFVSCSFDSTIKLWDLNTSELIKTFYGHKNQIRSVVFCPNSTKLLSGCYDNTAKLWDVDTGELLHTFEHNSPVFCVRYSPDSLKVASAGLSEKIKIWKVPDITDVAEQDFPAEVELIISPNPATDYVEVAIPLLERGLGGVAPVVRVFDVLGIEVMTASIHPMTQSHRMNIESLPPGVCFVQSGSRVQRFVKMEI